MIWSVRHLWTFRPVGQLTWLKKIACTRVERILRGKTTIFKTHAFVVVSWESIRVAMTVNATGSSKTEKNPQRTRHAWKKMNRTLHEGVVLFFDLYFIIHSARTDVYVFQCAVHTAANDTRSWWISWPTRTIKTMALGRLRTVTGTPAHWRRDGHPITVWLSCLVRGYPISNSSPRAELL